MKKLLACIITACCFCGCNNSNDKHQDTGEERIDTSDCSVLLRNVKMDVNTYFFTLAKSIWIKNDGKPNIRVDMNKYPDAVGLGDFMITFACDSPFCSDLRSHVIFTLVDNSNFTLVNFSGDNCKGEFGVNFEAVSNGISEEQAAVDLQKIKSTKLHVLRFETRNGYKDYIVTDIEATNLQRAIDCLFSRK